MTEPQKKQSTILLGSYGRGNLGDDVFLVAAGQLFANHKLYINSADDSLLPDSAKGLVTTISTTSAGDFIKKLRVFMEVKNIVYWGGDVWVELYGDRFPRQSLYKMVVLNAIAKLFGKKVHYVGCGIGKLSGFSLWLARLSARMSDTIISRERRSAEVLGLSGTKVMPDLAINLPFYETRKHVLPRKGEKFTIGISLLYHLPDPEENFPKLSEHIAQFVADLPKERFRVVLLPMLVSDAEPKDDLWASQKVLQNITSKGGEAEIYQAKDLPDMVRALGAFDLVIGTRLHADILGTFSATPCLGIAYRAKVSSFFRDNDLAQYCIDLDSLDRLPELFDYMYNNYNEAAEQFYAAAERNLNQRSDYQTFAAQYE